MKYEQLFSMLIQGDQQQLEHLFPTLAQCHTPIFDTLTWGEMYPLLSQWLKQVVKQVTLTQSEQFTHVWLGEWLFELTNGEELLVCCIIDPTTSHGMDIRIYHSFVPLFGKNQSREQMPLQAEVSKGVLPTLVQAEQIYYLPATGRKNVKVDSVEIAQSWEILTQVVTDIHAHWQSETSELFEYSKDSGEGGVVLVIRNNVGKVIAIRNYNDWE